VENFEISESDAAYWASEFVNYETLKGREPSRELLYLSHNHHSKFTASMPKNT
jgi:hypothetical protein